jgi:hypothetical protein
MVHPKPNPHLRSTTYSLLNDLTGLNMGMSRHIPVARLTPPKTITLPDGRVIQTADILLPAQDRRSYNLRTGTEYRGKRKTTKAVDTANKK